MRFVVRRPSPALAPFVASIWSFTAPDLGHARERILANGGMQLLVNLEEDELLWWEGERFERAHRIDGASLEGAFDRPFAIDTAEQRDIVGVSFRPGGAWAFFRDPPSAIAGEHVPLDALWARDGAVLRERLLEVRGVEPRLALLEAMLLARLRAPGSGAGALDVGLAVDALGRGTSIRALSEHLGCTEKRFVASFRERVGLTPKRFQRLLRFRRVLEIAAAGGAVDWARIAADCGYYDQSHLVHEFREFAGIAPSSYAPRSATAVGHVALDEAELAALSSKSEPHASAKVSA